METSKYRTRTDYHVEALTEEVEKNGIAVVDDVDRMPAYGEPYISKEMTIILCQGGIAHGEYDMKPIVLRQNDFSIIYPNHSVVANNTSDDYRATLVIISNNFYEEISRRFVYDNSLIFHNQPVLHLTDRQFQCFYEAIRFLKSVSKLNIQRSKDIVASILNTMSLLDDEFRRSNYTGKSTQAKPNQPHAPASTASTKASSTTTRKAEKYASMHDNSASRPSTSAAS